MPSPDRGTRKRIKEALERQKKRDKDKKKKKPGRKKLAWFVVYRDLDGELLSESTDEGVVPSPAFLAANGFVRLDVAFDIPATRASKKWNTLLKDYEDVTPPAGSLTVLDFWNRFTVVEREDLLDAANNGTVPQQKKLKAFYSYLDANGSVDLDDQYIIDSVNLAEQQNLIANGRAAQILAPGTYLIVTGKL